MVWEGVEVKPEVYLVIEGSRGRCVLDPKIARVLERVGNGEWLYPSFDKEGISRSCGHKKLRAIENSLGMKLSNGRNGSGSVLTKEGEHIVALWQEAQERAEG